MDNMISDAILWLVWAVLSPFVNYFANLNDVSLDSGVSGAIYNATHYIANLNELLPVGTIMAVFLAILGVEGIIQIYKISMWGVRRIPGQS